MSRFVNSMLRELGVTRRELDIVFKRTRVRSFSIAWWTLVIGGSLLAILSFYLVYCGLYAHMYPNV